VFEVRERVRPLKAFEEKDNDLKIVEGLNGERFVVEQELDME
jgi:hypothetical protein